MEKYEIFEATFQPQHLDDLKPGAEEWIGRRLSWEAAWLIDEGPYEGQWACVVQDNTPKPWFWVPSGDLVR